MSATTPALIAAAAGVGFGHAILPDHWVPLAVIGRTQHYRVGRIARLSGLAGVAHVLVSIVLGGVIIAIGLQLRSQVAGAENAIVGSVLLATGVAFAALELSGRGHHHHDHDHEPHEHDHAPRAARTRARGLAAIMVPFGAAASPDLTILPVFLAATAARTFAAVGALIVFSAVTIATIVTLTVAASLGGRQLRGNRLDRWGNPVHRRRARRDRRARRRRRRSPRGRPRGDRRRLDLEELDRRVVDLQRGVRDLEALGEQGRERATRAVAVPRPGPRARAPRARGTRR